MWKCIPVIVCAGLAATAVIVPLHHPTQFLVEHPPRPACAEACRWVWWGPTTEPASQPPPPPYTTSPGGVIYPTGSDWQSHAWDHQRRWWRPREQRPQSVPEPGAAVLLGSASIALAMLRRKNRKGE
jgi:hypothetical protein